MPIEIALMAELEIVVIGPTNPFAFGEVYAEPIVLELYLKTVVGGGDGGHAAVITDVRRRRQPLVRG